MLLGDEHFELLEDLTPTNLIVIDKSGRSVGRAGVGVPLFLKKKKVSE
jgi:hypothetical protein